MHDLQSILEVTHDLVCRREGEGRNEGEGQLEWHDSIQEVIHPCEVIDVL